MSAPRPDPRNPPPPDSRHSRSEREKPMYQPSSGGNGWGGVQHAHQRITELEEKFSSMREDVATIKERMLTEEKMRALLDWGPRREEQTYRGWQQANYQQVRAFPQDQRAQQSLSYQAEQTRTYHTQTLLMGLTIFLTPILSVILARLFG